MSSSLTLVLTCRAPDLEKGASSMSPRPCLCWVREMARYLRTVNKECMGSEGCVAAQQLRGFIEIKVFAMFLQMMTCPVDKAGVVLLFGQVWKAIFFPHKFIGFLEEISE